MLGTKFYFKFGTVYWKPEDMNYHSVCLHVLADSIRRYLFFESKIFIFCLLFRLCFFNNL
jgi:hypothetical protein